MSNSILTNSLIAKEALIQLENQMVLGNLVHRGYEDEFDKKASGYAAGSSVTIRKPPRYALRTGANMSVQDSIEGSVTLSVDQQMGVDLGGWISADRTLRLDQRGVPRKGMPTLNAPAAKPLAMPTPVQDGPYRQAQVPKPMVRVSELSDKTALTVRPAIGIRPGMYYAQDGTLRAIPFKQQPIGAVKGFPETGTNAWRAGNDGAIVDGVNAHHVRHGFLPGDEQFMTPGLVKSWTMKESGGDRARFESDPLTANHSGDWTADKERMLGLRHRQAMAPDTSVSAGLE